MLIEKILEVLQVQAELTVDLINSFSGGKHTSNQKMRRSIRYGPRPFKTDWPKWYKERQRFYSLLNYLKKEGLIEKKQQGESSLWHVTKKGVEKLKSLKKKRANSYSLADCKYQALSGDGVTIVAFDVPEKERTKRRWLREILSLMGFNFLQKSVWVGKGKIPEDFIHELRHKNMLSFVHIFSLSKQGTIRQIK